MLATMEQRETAKGFRCRYCGSCEMFVCYTRRERDRVVRVRECKDCGKRIRTYEDVGTGTPSKRGPNRT